MVRAYRGNEEEEAGNKISAVVRVCPHRGEEEQEGDDSLGHVASTYSLAASHISRCIAVYVYVDPIALLSSRLYTDFNYLKFERIGSCPSSALSRKPTTHQPELTPR